MSARKPAGQSPRRRTRQETSAGGVVVRVENGRPLYLLIRDSYGAWGFPKGHVEHGERPDTAALREVAEETGLRDLTLRAPITPIDWIFMWRGTLIRKRCHYFLMESSVAATRPQTAEGITACRWSALDDALRLIPHANARDVLRRADDLVAARAAAGDTR